MISRYSRTGLNLLGLALFGGPALAGLAGQGWAVLPVFAALFLLYVAATHKPDLSTAAGWAGLALMAAIQGMLVSVVYGLGLLAAQAAGPVIALPLWAPVLVTGAAAGFGLWAFRDAAEMDVMLDSALKALGETDDMLRKDRPEAPWPEAAPEVQAAADRALQAVRGAQTLDAGFVDPIVQQLESEAGVHAFDPLYDAAGLEAGANEPIVDFALLRFIASPGILSQLIDRGEGGLAPMLLLNAPSAAVRAEARACVGDLFDQKAPLNQQPDPGWLAELAGQFPGEGFEALAGELAGQAGRKKAVLSRAGSR